MSRLRSERFFRWWPFYGFVLILGLMVSGCEQGGAREVKSPGEAAGAAPLKLQVTAAELRNWPHVVRVQGSLMSDERSVVGAKVAGRVKQVNVDLGSVVRQGDVLVTLETEELDIKVQQAEARLKQALANLGLKPDGKEDKLDPAKDIPAVVEQASLWTEAKANLDRAKALAAERAMPVEDLQQRQAAVEVAEAKYRAAINEAGDQVAAVGVCRADLALARQVLADAAIRAPFDGAIQHREVAPGTYLQVGQAVVCLVRTNPLRFRAGVPEREAARVRLQQHACIRVEGEEKLFRGKVTRISPAMDMSNRSLIVEVDLPNPQGELRVGLFAEADIVVDPKARALAAPIKSISEFAGVEKVWLVRQGKAEGRAVQTGRRGDDLVEVLQALAPGELADRSQALDGLKPGDLAGLVEILGGLTPGDLVAVDASQGRTGPVEIERP